MGKSRNIVQTTNEDLIDEGILSQIKLNYIRLEESIISQLGMANKKHHVTTGTFREDIWRSLFEQIIPRKFSIEQSVFIMDSQKRVSKEVDLAIFDEMYTPYIFRYGRIKYIPIEAVAVVIQCKSENVTNKKEKKTLSDWYESIKILQTSLKSVTRFATNLGLGEFEYKKDKNDKPCLPPGGRRLTQTATRPIRILCHTNQKSDEDLLESFDIIIHPKRDKKGLNVLLNKESKDQENNLAYWYESLNHANEYYSNLKQDFWDGKKTEDLSKTFNIDNYRVYDSADEKSRTEISVLSLTFLLNQLLMLLNNPIPFPHLAYAKMFNEISSSISRRGSRPS
ncbi:hypothetical protein IJ21_15320 [Paenibacillus sp. 32O-W]|uniref:DUF6602 domain-containing protein n=1 Tax=Paenibacillus sp. 32O-W TaxID=1695218 RepID=UPI00071FBE77|nr:DUF6602 domain-containing protein [Paenibacillus sp. 32O-W]ALS26936.1 hypothetical protein IJ21_15320 [Paenibacillus sp. 32O-W]